MRRTVTLAATLLLALTLNASAALADDGRGSADRGADGIDRDCADFATQPDAQAYFDNDGGSSERNVDRLDGPDRDGVVCERLPSGSTTSASPATSTTVGDGDESTTTSRPAGAINSGSIGGSVSTTVSSATTGVQAGPSPAGTPTAEPAGGQLPFTGPSGTAVAFAVALTVVTAGVLLAWQARHRGRHVRH